MPGDVRAGVAVEATRHHHEGGENQSRNVAWKNHLKLLDPMSAGPIFGSASSERSWPRLQPAANSNTNSRSWRLKNGAILSAESGPSLASRPSSDGITSPSGPSKDRSMFSSARSAPTRASTQL